MTIEPEWDKPFVTLQCPACGTRYPAAVNKSPLVERELRCQRCLVAALTKCERERDERDER